MHDKKQPRSLTQSRFLAAPDSLGGRGTFPNAGPSEGQGQRPDARAMQDGPERIVRRTRPHGTTVFV